MDVVALGDGGRRTVNTGGGAGGRGRRGRVLSDSAHSCGGEQSSLGVAHRREGGALSYRCSLWALLHQTGYGNRPFLPLLLSLVQGRRRWNSERSERGQGSPHPGCEMNLDVTFSHPSPDTQFQGRACPCIYTFLFFPAQGSWQARSGTPRCLSTDPSRRARPCHLTPRLGARCIPGSAAFSRATQVGRTARR